MQDHSENNGFHQHITLTPALSQREREQDDMHQLKCGGALVIRVAISGYALGEFGVF